MKRYWHSVTLEPDFCNGCTYCLDRCPTQAIRVIDGKASIIEARCIDCGECLKVCPFKAKGAQTDSLDRLKEFKYTIALPAIPIYGQFPLEYDINKIYNGFLQMGFNDVFDVAHAADLLTLYERDIVKRENVKRPLISTSCPVISRIIQIKYPSLIDHIIRLEAPLEIAGRVARKKAIEETGLSSRDIGIFYITPCPAQVTMIKKPIGIEQSAIDGAVSMEVIYSKIIKNYDDIVIEKNLQNSTGKGIGWGRVGGQSYAMELEDYIAVDGIDEVMKVLDEIELGKLSEFKFFEGHACVNGCIGGPLNVENSFVGKNRIRKQTKIYGMDKPIDVDVPLTKELMEWDKEIQPLQVMKLDKDFKKALAKMAKIEEILHVLPNINCGACGAPTCRALAEDIVLGKADISECVVLMRGN